MVGLVDLLQHHWTSGQFTESKPVNTSVVL
jgi:hypothetical protein